MDEKVLRKIKRCLALAKSSNANEAATALRQAQALMEQHGIAKEDVDASDVNAHLANSPSGKTPPQYIAGLAGLVGEAFAVDPVYNPRFDGRTWKGRMEFIGVDSAPQIAAYAFEVLLRQLRKDRSAFLRKLDKRIKQTTKLKRADNYAIGWLLAVADNVSPRNKTEQEQRAILAYKQRLSIEEIRAIDRGRSKRDHNAIHQGIQDGRKVKFYDGVGADAGPQRLQQF